MDLRQDMVRCTGEDDGSFRHFDSSEYGGMSAIYNNGGRKRALLEV